MTAGGDGARRLVSYQPGIDIESVDPQHRYLYEVRSYAPPSQPDARAAPAPEPWAWRWMWLIVVVLFILAVGLKTLNRSSPGPYHLASPEPAAAASAAFSVAPVR